MDSSQGLGAVGTIIYLVVLVVEIAALWILFTKAGRPGWGAIIPIYNLYLLVKIAGRSGWWVVLYFIPIVDIVIYIILMLDLAKAYGRGTGFGLGLIFLSPIFIPILAFGSSTYQGPRSQMGSGPAFA